MLKVAITVASVLIGLPVLAQDCGQAARPIDEVLSVLAEKYHELPLWTGEGASNGFTVVLTVDPDGGTWTLVFVKPDRCAAPALAGDNWLKGTNLAGKEG